MGAYEAALKYAQERLQFGKPIGSFQLVQDLLAKMIANITASQCLIVRQAQLHAEGKLTDAHAALAKAFCTAKCRETVAWARELLGRQRHRRRLQRRALLRRCRSALLLRRHVPDAEPDRRQGDHRASAPSCDVEARELPARPSDRSISRLQQAGDIAPRSPDTDLALTNVLYEKKGAIAYVTVNRPKVLNALNTPTWEDLRTAFEDARDDAAVRGVILTGAGDKAFIAGADIGELAHVTAVEAEQSSRFGQEVLDLIENLGKPVIAAVNGFALGGGCETAMACTIRIAVGERQDSASPKSSSGSFRAAAARSVCRGWSARAAPCSSSSPAR